MAQTAKPKAETKAERYGKALAAKICAVYGFPVARIPATAVQKCEFFFLDSESAGEDGAEDAKTYLEWLQKATESNHSRKEQQPPRGALKACASIGTYFSRASAWAKFKRQKPVFNSNKPSRYLNDTRAPDQIPTDAEWREFLRDLAKASAGKLTNEDRERWGTV